MPVKSLPVGSAREPILKPVRITELRPTQITVGMREVEARRAHWRGWRAAKSARPFCKSISFP